MLKEIMMAECDLCGALEKPIRQQHIDAGESYALPDGWMRSCVNGQFCLCRECAQKFHAIDQEKQGVMKTPPRNPKII